MHEDLTPYDEELEKIILGELMFDKNAVYSVINKLSEDSFYNCSHKKIFNAINELYLENSGIDIITVTNKLKKLGSIEDVGGPLYITQLTSNIFSSSHIIEHCDILCDLAIKRNLIRIGLDLQEHGYNEQILAKESIEYAENEIFKLHIQKDKKEPVHIVNGVKEALDYYEKSNNHKLTGIPTGFRKLDDMLGGWQKSNFIIIGGRPYMGKTWLSEYFTLSAAESGFPTLVFTLEMSTREMSSRYIGMKTGISYTDVRNGLTDGQWGEIELAVRKITDSPLYIDDSPSLTIGDIKTKSKMMKIKHNIQLIVIDYLQLIKLESKSLMSTHERISYINKECKALAKDLDIPLILLSQLNRETEKSGDKGPKMIHLKESGSSEEDADIVMFVHRPEYYKDPDAEHNVGEILVEKHRNGQTGIVLFRHSENKTKIFEY